MKRFLLFFIVWFTLQHAPAQQLRSKINIPLRNLISEFQHTEEQVNLYVNADPASLQLFLLEKKALYKYPAGNWHAIRLLVKDVPELSEQPWLHSIHYENYRGEMMNDTMRIRNNVDSVHAGYPPLNSSYSGKGVLAAFIDTGIDFNHGDFLDSLGNTRVLAIWDQTQPFDPSRTPVKYGYGQVWDSTDINAGICTSADTYAHGTTVSGCTSGNGNETNAFKGLAPESSILIVKNNLSAVNWLTTIADAVDYLFYVADSLNMPCVINISLGTYLGSHDGRDPSARVIDSLVRAKEGRLISAAAGNSGNSGNYHLETIVTQDTSFTWFTYNSSSSLGYGAVYFEVFADTADFNNVHYAMGADNTSPYNFRGRTEFHNINDHLGTVLTDTIWNSGNIIGIVDYYAELMGDVYRLEVHMQQPDSNQYRFRLMTTGSGEFDVWSASWLGTSGMISSGLPSAAVFPDIVNYVAPDSAKIIVSSFTCLETVITVANYNNYLNYIDYAGNMQTFPGNVGQIALGSSRGPTRDNRVKPEIAATGDLTMSAGPLASLAYMQVNEPWKLTPDGMHMRNGGTSMAAPVVAGVGVLLLEKCPQMNWQDFRDVIIATAKTDSFTGTVPNISYGYGKVNAFRSLVETNFSVIVSGDTSFCQGDSTQLSVPGAFSSFLWNNTSTLSSVSVDSSAAVSVIVTDDRGCKSNPAQLTVTEYPVPGIPNIKMLTTSGPVLIFISDTAAVSYTWYAYDAGAPVVVGTGDSIGFNVNTFGFTNYLYIYVEISNSAGCTSVSDTVFVILNSVDENLPEKEIQVFPNPSEGKFSIHNPGEAFIAVEITDLSGKLVHRVPSADCGKEIITINKSLPPGVYFISLISGENRFVEKHLIIKE